jgi:uncharacterized damage-inducible protein DinB
MPSDLVQTWRKNNEVNYMLLAAIPDAALGDRYSARTRTVAAQFAHLHNVRVYHLQKRGARFLGNLRPFPRGAQPGKRELKAALEASESAMADFLMECERTKKVKSWQGSPAKFLGYLISHEGHHRGLTLVCLRIGGTKLPQKITYGIWDCWRKE